jgi:serine/threonine-protein kinase
VPTSSIVCPSCSAQVPAGSRFCLNCGKALPPLSQLPTATAEALPLKIVARAHRVISSDSIPVGGFTPGIVLLERYRIIGLLGRGGMGEVYRADDLRLGQPVALKFLPKGLALDPVRRERFFAEVRITRQLAHPNICRVYDIAEVDGQHFLSMEYIDGEDLASLLKRIGYLSNEKALEIARQLVAGIAAAHDRGVLHRDLKPANIMIDGHGRVRITDFGLAVAADDEKETMKNFGTPAYMAPEQFAGKPGSIRSDIYAIGLILYEIFTGKKAFTADTIAELRQQKEGQTPIAPSEIRQGLDPFVERLIMRCIERDPRARPASATQLAASLPGGDPLAAALAAGETPSPEMVAAAGMKDGLRPSVAVVLLAFVVVGSLAAMFLKDRTDLVQLFPEAKPRDVLVERAKEIVRKAGYSTEGADVAYGYRWEPRVLQSLSGDASADDAVYFWYRASPKPLVHWATSVFDHVWSDDPPLLVPGETIVRLDQQGRLRRFDAVPVSESPAPASLNGPSSTDWSVLFAEAGVSAGEWTPAEPLWLPTQFADTRSAWRSHASESTAAIEAAAYRGKPVSFRLLSQSDVQVETQSSWRGQRVFEILATFVLFGLIAGGVFFARKNLRLGRGDRRGAARVSALCGLGVLAGWALGEHHVPTTSENYLLIREGISSSVILASLMWILYISLEPFARRRLPQVLFSWSRLLSGGLRDPLVGRDVLMGCAAGLALTCISRVAVLVSGWAESKSWVFAAQAPPFDPFHGLAGPGAFLSRLSLLPGSAIVPPVVVLFFIVILRYLLRSELAAVGITSLVGTFALVPANGISSAGIPVLLVGGILSVIILVKAGFVAAIAAWFVHLCFASFPITLHTSAWFAAMGFAALLIVLALAFYGFWTAIGNRPILDTADADD